MKKTAAFRREKDVYKRQKLVGVESHVLRYWEDELQLEIPRNGKSHRYYTDVYKRQMMKNVQATMGAMDTSLDYMENMTLRTEGEDRIISYTMNEGAMNDLVQKVLGMTGTPAGQEGMKMTYRDVSGEYVVNPEGYYTKARTRMAMDMTVGEMRLTMNIDGDVGVADPGQPVEVPVPNPEEYELMETASQ